MYGRKKSDPEGMASSCIGSTYRFWVAKSTFASLDKKKSGLFQTTGMRYSLKKALKENATIRPRLRTLVATKYSGDCSITHPESRGDLLFAQFQPRCIFVCLHRGLWGFLLFSPYSCFLSPLWQWASANIKNQQQLKKDQLALREVGSVGKKSLPQANREIWERKN